MQIWTKLVELFGVGFGSTQQRQQHEEIAIFLTNLDPLSLHYYATSITEVIPSHDTLLFWGRLQDQFSFIVSSLGLKVSALQQASKDFDL